MNRFLANSLSTLNAFIALLIIILGTFFGYLLLSRAMGLGSSGAMIGAIIGLVIAALTCGIIAHLILIERHLAILSGKKTKHESELAANKNH